MADAEVIDPRLVGTWKLSKNQPGFQYTRTLRADGTSDMRLAGNAITLPGIVRTTKAGRIWMREGGFRYWCDQVTGGLVGRRFFLTRPAEEAELTVVSHDEVNLKHLAYGVVKYFMRASD